MTSEAWTDVLGYLGRLGANDVILATELLERAIDRDGIGAINDALADACRSAMDRVLFPAGTVDIHAVVDTIARRIVETSDVRLTPRRRASYPCASTAPR